MDVRRRASIFCFPLLPEITKPALVWASAAACGAALYLQICYQNHLVQIHDVGAILDTTDALVFVAGVLLAVTLALDAFALAVWGTEKGKSGADA